METKKIPGKVNLFLRISGQSREHKSCEIQIKYYECQLILEVLRGSQIYVYRNPEFFNFEMESDK